jgi:hypothetical protein
LYLDFGNTRKKEPDEDQVPKGRSWRKPVHFCTEQHLKGGEWLYKEINA